MIRRVVGEGVLRKSIWVFFACLSFSVPPGEVFALDGGLGKPETGLRRNQDGKWVLSKSLDVTLSGYLEGSYTQNFNNPSNRINQLRIFDVNSNEFRPNLAKIVLEREARADGQGWDRAGFRVKFNAGMDSQYIAGTNLNDYADFQEFYAQYVLPVGNGLDLKAGRINTLIGYEVLESPENPNYSRSWLFGIGQPYTTFGIRASYQFNKQVAFSIGGINSISSATSDATNDLMVESALVLTPSDRVKLTFYGFFGPRKGQEHHSGNRVLGGGFIQVQVTEQVAAVLEAFYANQERGSRLSQAGNARWSGVAGYLIYDVNRQWSLRLRGEIFEDAGGFVSCNGTESLPKANVCFGATPHRTSPDVAQTLWESTTTLQWKPFDSLLTRLEYRYDRSNRQVFQLGDRAAGYQPTLSLNVVYFF